MKKYLVVKENEHLVRDTESGAIINQDRAAWENYQLQKQARAIKAIKEQKQKETINNLENDMNVLKDELNNMKTLLDRILEKLDG